MTLQRDALELLQTTAQEAQRATLLPVPGDGRTAYVDKGAEIQTFPIPARPREHHVGSLSDLVNYAVHASEVANNLVVWHGPSSVVLLLDDSDRRDRVIFDLGFASRYEVLRTLAKDRTAFRQADFIRLLRIDLALDNVAVVAQFRRLDFSFDKQGSGTIGHGSDRVGKTILAEVRGVADLPEWLDVSVPVYQQTGERDEYIVRCLLEIDAINERFYLIPQQDALQEALDKAQESIYVRLEEGLKSINKESVVIPIYYGTP